MSFCVSFKNRGSEQTKHLADVGLDVDILKVLEGVSVEQPESGVQSDRNPDTIAVPGKLTHLAVLTRVGVEGFLWRIEERVNEQKRRNLGFHGL